MFELPEYVVLSSQINTTLKGKTIQRGLLGNSPHKFVWYNRGYEEFERLTQGKVLGEAWVQGRWLFVPLEPGYVLLFGECGGKLLYHPAGSKLPKKYHLYITFEDDSFLTATTQMWGAYELYERGEEQNREYVKDMRTTPVDPGFTYDYFSALIDELVPIKKRSAKSLLTQDQIIPGLGNAIAQDILFHARLHPKHPISELSGEQKRALYDAIVSTVDQVIQEGGRYDETDLYNNPGGYTRLMDKNALTQPCPDCGGVIQKFQYLGGACYVCPTCQE
jgi:formamidopyrimidine-DNA glycosylase